MLTGCVSFLIIFKEKIIVYILDNFSLFLSPYRQHPAFIERLNIAVENFFLTLFLAIIVIFFYKIISSRIKKTFVRVLLCSYFYLPVIIRFVYDYAYDTPFAFLCQSADILILTYFFFKLGEKTLKEKNIFYNIAAGIAILALVSLLCHILKLTHFIAKPYIAFHILSATYLSWTVLKKLPVIYSFIDIRKALVPLLIIIIILPFMFIPSVPSPEAHTLNELIGYLLQKQSLWHIESGVANEWYSIRYPAGMATLGCSVACLLNIRASESILLIWYINYFLLISGLMIIVKKLEINRWIVLLFLLNPLFIKMNFLLSPAKSLSFSLGIYMLLLLQEKRNNLCIILLVAATVIHPVAAIPFWVPYIFIILKGILDRTFLIKKNYIFIVSLIFLFIYIGILISGRSLVSHNVFSLETLRKLTIEVFWGNIINNLSHGTFNSQFFLLSLVAGFFLKSNKHFYSLIILWLAGILIFNGIWGKLLSVGINMVTPIWALSVSLFYTFINRHVSGKMKNIIFLSFFIYYVIFIGPQFVFIKPACGITHSDIRMGRYIEKHIPANSLIANIPPPPEVIKYHMIDYYPEKFYPDLRGNSIHNSVFSNLSITHQIKNGNLINREPYLLCSAKKNEDIVNCFKKLGVSYIFLSARPDTKDFVKSLNLQPLKNFGHTYLFKII